MGSVPILFGMVIVIEKKVSIGKDVEDLPIIEIGDIRLTQVNPRYTASWIDSSASNILSLHRRHGYSLLNQPVKSLPEVFRSTSIESDGIFIRT